VSYSLFNHILKPYIGEDLVLGKKYSSPVKGRRDSSPSFSVKEHEGKHYWRDWGYSGKESKNAVGLLQAIHGITYWEAKQMIDSAEFPEVKPKSRRSTTYRPVWDKLNYSEILWWSEINVRYPTLVRYKVKGARMLVGWGVMYDGKEIAFYYVGEVKTCWQMYSSKPKRFHKNGSWILGWEQLPLTGDVLLIVSGMKDGLVTYECGFNFIAGSGEGDWESISRLLPELRLRFRRIFTLLDPDKAGREATERYKEIGVNPLPFTYPNTRHDIAELSKRRGLKWLKSELWKNL
jgi:hypothetical protein